MNMYMNKEEAMKYGFTHNGRYYFLPIYMTAGDPPMVSVKCSLFEVVFDILLWIESVMVIEGEIPNFTVLDELKIDQ